MGGPEGFGNLGSDSVGEIWRFSVSMKGIELLGLGGKKKKCIGMGLEAGAWVITKKKKKIEPKFSSPEVQCGPVPTLDHTGLRPCSHRRN